MFLKKQDITKNVYFGSFSFFCMKHQRNNKRRYEYYTNNERRV